jgi:hypothetical protein
MFIPFAKIIPNKQQPLCPNQAVWLKLMNDGVRIGRKKNRSGEKRSPGRLN